MRKNSRPVASAVSLPPSMKSETKELPKPTTRKKVQTLKFPKTKSWKIRTTACTTLNDGLLILRFFLHISLLPASKLEIAGLFIALVKLNHA